MGRKTLGIGIIALTIGCSPAPGAPDTYTIDLSHFTGPGVVGLGGAPRFANESLAFRPDLDEKVKLITGEGSDFRKIDNRLPCQRPIQSTNEELALQGFRGTEDLAAPRPVQLSSVSLVKPDGEFPILNIDQICFAYHTSDGKWHGRFEPVAMMRDEAAKLRRATLPVNADNVDIIGLVVYSGLVSSVSFVARPQ